MAEGSSRKRTRTKSRTARTPERIRFAKMFVRKMTVRGLSIDGLAREAGLWPSQVTRYRSGDALPARHILARLATVLDWPGLVKAYDNVLAAVCEYCGGAYTKSYRSPSRQRFCNEACKLLWQVDTGKAKRRLAQPDTIAHLRGRLVGKEGRIENLTYERNAMRDAIAAFCRTCEWDGICKTPGCEVREFSPLPLAKAKSTTALQKTG